MLSPIRRYLIIAPDEPSKCQGHLRTIEQLAKQPNMTRGDARLALDLLLIDEHMRCGGLEILRFA